MGGFASLEHPPSAPMTGVWAPARPASSAAISMFTFGVVNLRRGKIGGHSETREWLQRTRPCGNGWWRQGSRMAWSACAVQTWHILKMLTKFDVMAQHCQTATAWQQPERRAKSETRATTGEQYVSCASVQERYDHRQPRAHPRARPEEAREETLRHFLRRLNEGRTTVGRTTAKS